MKLSEALRILADVHTYSWMSVGNRWSVNLKMPARITPEYVEAWRVVREYVYGQSDY